MEYFFYSIDLEIMEQIKQMKKNNVDEEEILIEIKTSGQYLGTYDEKSFCELIAKLGEDNAKYLNKEYIDLVELKALYENIKTDFDNEVIREFKIMIYKPISNCKGIVLLKMKTKEDIEIVPKKKWFEIWKK